MSYVLIFPQPRKISPVNKFFHSEGDFPHSKFFFTGKKLPQTRKFSQNIFPWLRKFSTKKDFCTIKNVFCKQRPKRFPKAKTLGPFNTKSYAKIVLTFSSCWQQKIIPANTGNKRFKYKALLLNIKKLILYKVLIEWTSMQTN